MPRLGGGEYLQVPNFLSEKEVNEVAVRIHTLKAFWNSDCETENSTLGLAWYKMLEDGMMHAYHAHAQSINEILINNFPNYLAKVVEVGSWLCNADGDNGFPVYPRSLDLGPYWTMFGFSMVDQKAMEGDSEVSKDDVVIAHMDYEGLSPYPSMLFDKNTRAYSALFSIQAPESGSGLKVYPKRFLGNEFNGPSLAKGWNNDKKFLDLLADKIVEPVHLEYKPGTVSIIDSFMAHAVEPGIFSKEKQWRTVGVVHYLYLDYPLPHFQFWY